MRFSRLRNTMLTARLFAGLAVAVAICAFAPIGRGPMLDIYVHDTYFVVGHFHILLVLAFLCAVLALVSFAFGRWSFRQLSRAIGIASFVLIAIGIAAFVVADMFLQRAPEEMHGYAVILSSAIFAIFLGCVLAAGNVVWTLVVLLVARLRSR